MNRYLLVLRHYLKRSFEPLGILILTVLPLAIIIMLNMVYSSNDSENIYYNGYNMASTHISMSLMLMFQFIGGNIILEHLYSDFKSDKRWRLLSTPCPLHVFIFSASISSIIFSILQGAVIVIITTVFLDAYWANPLVLIIVVLLLSIISHLIHMIIFIFSNKKATAESISNIMSWGMVAISGTLFPLPKNTLTDFFAEYGTLFSLSATAITQSGFVGGENYNIVFQCILVLSIIAILLGAAIIFLGRRRKF